MTEKQPPHKKRKLEPTKKFTSAEQIRQSLRAQNLDALVETLNQVRNQLTIKSDEGVISPQDERLAIAQEWLEKSPGAQDVFNIWENANPRQHNLLVAIVSVLGVLLPLLSSHFTYHAVGYPITKALLTPQWMRRLNSYIGGTHNELILVTLKLLIAISGFAGGREKKTLLDAFQWEIKSLPRLLNLRRKGKVDYNPLTRPDIRTLYIFFLLSFLDAPTQTKNTLLEQHRDAFLAIFKGLPQDHYLFVRHVLEALWINLWSDPKVKRTTKVGLFNETTISHLLKIYERTSSDSEDPEQIPADLVHHFLLAITSRPGTGICFKDRGWYPREDTEDEKGGRIYNKILANVLKTLKVNEDSRQQELARRVLEACPELIAGYWPSAQLTLEPRLSTKWIANISFFGTIISLPVPENTFFLPNTNLYNPTPPPLHTILSNILPSDISPKNIFTKGLLSNSGLVQHCTALTLVKCLMKYAKVLEVFKAIEDALEVGDTEQGLWGKRREEVEREVRKRVPEFQVVVGFSQQKTPVPSGTGQSAVASQQPPNPVRNALLQESAQRLLLLYHKHLPEVVAEARFDVGKALTGFTTSIATRELEGDSEDPPDAAKKLNLIQQLHVLQMLKESSHFVWTNKSPSSRTYLYILLKSYTTSQISALKSTLLDLLSHLFSNCIFFQETPTEPRLWLLSLPCLVRAPNATSPDKAKLTDEAESVVTFLEDCVQRCLKTPFRYIEEMQERFTSISSSSEGKAGNSEAFPSPLIMTLGEQLDAKIKAGLLTPSDVLAITSFTRKLVFRLLSRVEEASFFDDFIPWIDGILSEDRLWLSDYPEMTAAIRREVKMMFEVVKPDQIVMPPDLNESLQEYLDEVESLPVADKVYDRQLAAHSIIDRLRFAKQPIPVPDTKRLILAIQRHWAPALQDLAQYFPPRSGCLWENHVLVGTDVGIIVSAVWLFYDSSKEQILDSDYRRNFIATFFSTKPTLQPCLELLRLIEHRLGIVDEDEVRALLSLIAAFVSETSLVLKDVDMVVLKENLFVRRCTVKNLAMTQDVDDRVRVGLCELLQSSFDPRSTVDRRILSEISAHWLAILQEQLNLGVYDKFGEAALWIKYLPPDPVFRLLDQLTSDDTLSQGPHSVPLLQSILDVIRNSIKDDAVTQNALRQRIPQLLKVRKQLVGSHIVEELLFTAIDSTLPVGYSPHSWSNEHDDLAHFAKFIEQAESRWDHRARPLECNVPLEDFLTSNTWTPWTPKIIASLLYKQGFGLKEIERWLGSGDSSRSSEHLAIIIQAALDIHHCLSLEKDPLNVDIWILHLSKITALCFDHDIESSLRQISVSCLELALDAFGDRPKDAIRVIVEYVDGHHTARPTLESIRLGVHPEIGPAIQEWTLRWLIGQLADDTFLSTETLRLIKAIDSLMRSSITIKAHQVETLLGVVIQHHLSHSSPVGLAIQCISRTHLKPVVVNRYLQSILHHPHFYKLTNGMNSEPNSRPHVVKLLFTLFNLHPTNTCQITQIEPLLQVYHGTLSNEDLHLFSIFQLFEIQRKTSLAPLFNRWSSSIDITCSSALDSLLSLDAARVFRTTLHFPSWRKLQVSLTHTSNPHDAQLYDPIFLLLLLHLVLSEHHPATPFGWIELLRTNIAGLCIRSLSSKDVSVRELGLSQLASLYKCIEDLEVQEKPHVMYVLNLLKDLFPPPESGDPPRRLPSYTTLVLAHALRGIFYPSNFIYPLTSRFLLQRPLLDANDVPMLYSMLYSNTDDWKKERGWIIRFLADGMASSDDWRVLKRRHTWDLLASLFQNSRSDRALRRGVFEVLANLTCNRQATMTMILKSSLLAWFEMQISEMNADENIQWARILGNVVIIIDHNKLDSVMKNAWRAGICRCLSALLNEQNAELVLPVIVPIVFRLGQYSNGLTQELEETIGLATKSLALIEARHVPDEPEGTEAVTTATHGLCPSYIIHEPPEPSYSYKTWLECVALLWRTTMISGHKPSSWDFLTSRLLASQCYDGLMREEAEWVRTEVIRSLQKYHT